MLDGIVRNIIILLFYPVPESSLLSSSSFLFVSFLFYIVFSPPFHPIFVTHPQLSSLTATIPLQRFYPRATLEHASRHRVLKKPGYCKYLLHHLPSFSHKDELLALIEYATGANNGVFLLFTGLLNAIFYTSKEQHRRYSRLIAQTFNIRIIRKTRCADSER